MIDIRRCNREAQPCLISTNKFIPIATRLQKLSAVGASKYTRSVSCLRFFSTELEKKRSMSWVNAIHYWMLTRMLRCRLQYFIFRLDDQVKVFILLWKRRSSTKERQLQDFLILCKVSKPKIAQFSLDDLPPFESYWYQVYLDHLWYAGIRKRMPSRCVMHAIILFRLI